MTLHPLFALLYAMLGYLIGWAVYAHLTTFVVAYALLAVGLAVIHYAYVQDLKRSETHDDDIDWDI
jgi:mannose/fructose/N-acetylgalactosamine-specific phosphotransferase system component IIC